MYILEKREINQYRMISKEAIEEFKKIWKEEFKEGISDEKALEKATKLLALIRAIYKPIK